MEAAVHLASATDPNHIDEHGNTPLQLAVTHGHAEMVRQLFKHRAAARFAAKAGESYLALAMRLGRASVLEAVLDAEEQRSTCRKAADGPPKLSQRQIEIADLECLA